MNNVTILKIKTDYYNNSTEVLINNAISNFVDTNWQLVNSKFSLNKDEAFKILVCNLLTQFDEFEVMQAFKQFKLITRAKKALKKAA